MIYLLGIAIAGLVLTTGAIVAVVYTWRKDLQAMQKIALQKIDLEGAIKSLRADNYELYKKYKVAQRAHFDIVTNKAIDEKAKALSGDPDSIVDTLRLQLSKPLDRSPEIIDPFDRTLSGVPTPPAPRSDTDRSDTEPGQDDGEPKNK